MRMMMMVVVMVVPKRSIRIDVVKHMVLENLNLKWLTKPSIKYSKSHVMRDANYCVPSKAHGE
jgi:hypothetical protein